MKISSTHGRAATLPKAAIALLVYVIVFRHETLRRDRIAYALWPDEPEVQARANLRRHLYLLGPALAGTDEPSLVVDARTVRWNGRPGVEVDLVAFEDAVESPHARAGAVELYRGDLALDLDAEWLDAPRASLRSRFCAAACDEARTALVASEPKRAIALAERVLALDPLREDAVRVVIEGRAASGDRAGALGFYRDFSARLRAEVDAEPMVATREVAERLSRSTVAPRAPLAAPLSRLIGRAHEIATIEEALESARVVTITGPGGVGKSRIAAEIATRFAHENEAIAVHLGSVANDRASIENAFLEAFEVPSTGDVAVDVVARIVGSRKMLLSIDNADRVTRATADFVDALLRRTAALRVLLTSQQRLHLEGERVIALPPLGVPGGEADFAEIERSEAVRLFVDRAKAIDASFALTPQLGSSIASICRHVDGMPLSLELAAGRSNVLAISEIEERLYDRFDFLRSNKVGESERHRTLRATLDWSFELLGSGEGASFCAFAVFANGWTLAAATALVGDALDDLSDLIEKSLVVTHNAGSSRRYGYQESIRLYARERLNSTGKRMELERRAFTYFAEFVRARADAFSSRKEKTALDEIAVDHDNILALLDAAIERGEIARSIALAVDLTPFWVARGFAVAGQARLDALLTHDAPVAARAGLRNAASRVHLVRGNIARAAMLAEEAAALGVAAGDERLEADALYALAKCDFSTQRFERYDAGLGRALAIYERIADRAGQANVLDLLGQFASGEAHRTEGTALFRRSLSLYESLGDLMGIAVVNYHLGFYALTRGHHDAAVTLNTRAMNAWRDYGFAQGEHLAKYNLASSEAAMGRRESAARLYFACATSAHRYGLRREICNALDRLAESIVEIDPALALRCLAYATSGREDSGYAVLPSDRETRERCLLHARERLSADDFASNWNLGRGLDEGELLASLRELVASDA